MKITPGTTNVTLTATIYAEYLANVAATTGFVYVDRGYIIPGKVLRDIPLRRNSVMNTRLKAPALQVGYAAKTSAYTITDTDYSINADATSAAFSVTLPTALDRAGSVFVVRKKDSSVNAVTVATTSAQTINGVTTYVLPSQNDYVLVESDGNNWMIVGASVISGVVPTSTTAALAAIANVVNTVGKYAGKTLYNTTTKKVVTADGATAGSVWVDATGATAHTPV